MNTQGGASVSLCANVRLFTTITSDEQYFLNEAVTNKDINHIHSCNLLSNCYL